MALAVPCIPAQLTLSELGGALDNLEGVPVEDPTTCLDAGCDNASRASVAALSHTFVQAWARFALSSAPALTGTNVGDAVWAQNTASGGLPVPTHAATGTFDMTFPSTVTDELGNTGVSINIRRARVQAEGSTLFFATCSVTAPNVVRVWTWNSSGSASDLTTAQIVLLEVG